MGQKLILPINNGKITASWKTQAYRTKFGFTHYGTDMVSTAGNVTLIASGDGKVLGLGNDSVLGNVLIIVYPKAIHKATGKEIDIVFRYCHLASFGVKVGQEIKRGDVIGKYGNTGKLKMPLHLHLEADSDTKNFDYSPTLRNGSYIKGTEAGATADTMYSAVDFLYTFIPKPYSQVFSTANDEYISLADKVKSETNS